jgi:hypothetical protein
MPKTSKAHRIVAKQQASSVGEISPLGRIFLALGAFFCPKNRPYFTSLRTKFCQRFFNIFKFVKKIFLQKVLIYNVWAIFYIIGTVARFLLIQTYRIWENIPNDHKLYKTAINYTKWP